MNKKVLTTLLVAAVAITGLFAEYSTPSVILNATAPESDYTFKLQIIDSSLPGGFMDVGEDYAEDITLTTTAGKSKVYAISTVSRGNMPKAIKFNTTITTGEFVDSTNASIKTGLYPTIHELSGAATAENNTRENNDNLGEDDDEKVNYTNNISGDYSKSAQGTFTTNFSRGIHLFGTEIARFQLGFKANDNTIAGSYTSETKINIKAN